MKPTQEQVIAWAREVWGDDSGKPWSEAALLHITQLATLAYEAGRVAENKAFEKELLKEDQECLDDEAYLIVTGLLKWIRARREQ